VGLWLDLRLAGHDPEKLRPVERSLLLGHLAQKRDTHFMELMIIVKTIFAAASLMASGKFDEGKLQDLLKDYSDLTYPDANAELEDKAKRIERIIRTEHERGPMKVQSMQHDGRKNKSARKRR
jgi:hypothetical protein